MPIVDLQLVLRRTFVVLLFVDWWLESPIPLVRAGSALPEHQPLWVSVGAPPNFCGFGFFWMKGFVDKACEDSVQSRSGISRCR